HRLLRLHVARKQRSHRRCGGEQACVEHVHQLVAARCDEVEARLERFQVEAHLGLLRVIDCLRPKTRFTRKAAPGTHPPLSCRFSDAVAQFPSSASTARTRRLSSSLSGRPSLRKIAWTSRSTARELRKSSLPIARFERPSAISESTSRSRSVRSSRAERRCPPT